MLVIATGVATAAPADPNNSKSINTFIKCLNDTGKPKASIADLIDACVPDKCKMTLTMSQESAQKACTLGGCKLPRVIFECAGPEMSLMFRPSLLLCPTDSKFNGEFGVNRIEVGEDTKNPKNATEIVMKMAEVNVPPPLLDGSGGTDLTKIDPKEVTSKVAGKGTNKNCNACHSGGALDPTADGDILSRRIDPNKFKAKDLSGFILKNAEIDASANASRITRTRSLRRPWTRTSPRSWEKAMWCRRRRQRSCRIRIRTSTPLRRYATRLPPISNGVLAANHSTYQAWRAQPCWVEENFWTRTQQYRHFEST
ncbi:MAG: hypothetical protein H0T80_10910 [Betaproteobacteria bacterium]|nr:hypothetical protein [Betaproteobacteria bacterium]